MNTDSRSERYRPFPELVEPRGRGRGAPAPYTIFDSLERSSSGMTGWVDKVARIMTVPLEPEGEAIGLHELGHVRYSPQRPAQVNFDARVLAVVEDARVNLGLHATELPVVLGETGDLYIAWLLANDAKHGDTFALFMRSVASIGTSVEPILCAQLARFEDPKARLALAATLHVRAELEKARLRAGGEVAPERRARSLARALARTLRALGLLDATGNSKSALVLDCSLAHAHEPAAAKAGASAAGPMLDELREVEPGRMRIARARLTRTVPVVRGMRAWRASTEGSVVRHTHRWVIDRAIFRKRGAQSRGTVLVDVSSSMSLVDGDLERLLVRAGQGTRVAIYSGKGEAGELRIVVDRGKRAEGDELARSGGGNIVDLPALRWLARQAGPRLWISDGKVTGVGDKSSFRLNHLCRVVCRRAAIRRVDDIDAAARLLGPR